MKRILDSNAALVGALLLLVLLMASLLPNLRSSADAVRLRNALLFDVSAPSDFDWVPSEVPASFALDRSAPTPLFDAVAASLKLEQAGSDWDRSLLVAAHLVRHARYGGAARSDLAGTYRKILAGGGYCSDFTSVFIALARPAGIFAREWAFSFDGYGGHGHAFIEVFDRESKQWRMLDVFNNFYPVDAATGQPLSAMAFRQRIVSRAGGVRIERIADRRLGFSDEQSLYAYYGDGADQWYLWWGNAVFDYDASPATRYLDRVSRSAEQLAAVALGVHPRIHPVPSERNQGMRQAMQRLKWRLLASALAGTLLALFIAVQLARRGLHRRDRRIAHA